MPNTLLVGSGGYATIQEAINAASSGDTIQIAAGTYGENVSVDKELTIIGSGDDTIIQGTFKTLNGLAPGDSVADFLKTATADYNAGAGKGVIIAANNVTLQNLQVSGFNVGVEFSGTVDNVTLDNVDIDATVDGIRKGTGTQVTDLDVLGGSITDSYIGMYISKETANGRDLSDVLISGTSFSHLVEKGIYAETLSDALITGITMNDVGQFGRGSADVFTGGNTANIGGFGGGIDINLKWDHETTTDTVDDAAPYSNITIQDFTFTDVGVSDKDGTAASHAGGAAIAVKARDQGSYASPEQASFSGAVIIQNGTIDGTSTGIRAGEPGQNITGPAVTVSDVAITHAVHSATHGDVNNVTQSTVTVNLNDSGVTLTPATGATGHFDIHGGTGDDTISGGAAADTMAGGAGNDAYYAHADDTISELSDSGTDEVRSTDSITLSSNVENLTLLDGDSDTQTFDDMSLGPITDGENGWQYGGPADRDQAVVDVGGDQMFRISSDPSSGDFSGPYSPSLSVSAGEPQTSADYDSQSIRFTFKAVSDTPDGSRVEIDFGNSDGTDRNNFMAIESSAATGGIRIAVNEPTLVGADDWTVDNFDAFTGNRTLISGVDPTVSHEIELRVTYVDGPDNDIIKVYLDGEYIGTTTTFENYRDAGYPEFPGATHAENAEANQTDRIFFRANAAGATADGPGGANQGFYFDNLTTSVYNNTDGTGNDDANVIDGNSGDNVLSGLGGDDTLHGDDGDDTLLGGLGNDTITGNAGDDDMTGGAGNDAIDGGAGTDTAHYSGTVSVTAAGGGWSANGGVPEGTDALSNVEVVDAAGGRILLVGNGGYATIQAAIDDATAGDTVLVAAGTYNENVTLKSGVTLEGAGADESDVVIHGTVSTPATLSDALVSNLSVESASATSLLLDLRGTSAMTDVVFDHVNFNVTQDYSNGDPPIGNGQGSGSINLIDLDGDGAGLTFSHVTVASNNHTITDSASNVIAYTTVHGATMVLDDVTLTGTVSGSATGLGAQWNMTPNTGETASVDIVNSHTSGGGNFYVSGMDGVTIQDNIFDGQGLALNGVTDATVTGNTFRNIDDTFTANGTQHRGLVIEDAWGTDGVSGVTVTGNTFQNIDAVDGTIALQRFTDGSPADTATIARLNDIDIHGNTFTDLGTGVQPTYLNPTYFGAGAVLPAGFHEAQLTIGTSGGDTITDASTGAMSIFADAGNDTVTGAAGNDAIDGGAGTDTAHYSGTVSVTAAGGGWSVNGGAPEGTDTLKNVEVVDDAAGGHILLVGNGGYALIQDAINAATAGDTIMVAAGTYNETLTIDKALTILGANAGHAGTSARGAETVLNWSTGNAVNVTTADAVTIDGLKFTGTNVTNITTVDTDLTFTNSVFQLTSGSSNFYLNQPEHFTFTGNLVRATGYTDALFQPVGTAGDPSHSVVTFTGNTINGVEGSGGSDDVPVVLNLSNVNGTVGGNIFNNVDIGMLVSNATGPLSITGNTFEDMHRADPDVSGFATAVVFFTPDHTSGADFGPITITGNTFDNLDAGIRTSSFGTPTVAGLSITIDDNDFTDVDHPAYQPAGGVLHLTNSTIDAVSVPSAFVAGPSDDTIAATSANDIVSSDGGADTVTYPGTLTRANITTVADADPLTDGNQAGWQVNAGVNGTDLLTGVDRVSDGAGHNFLLVGNGGYATIQSAIDAATAGDTIMIAAGTYDEHVTVGVDGLSLIGLGEVTIHGTFESDNSVTGDLSTWIIDHAYSGAAGDGVTIAADNVTLSNINIDGFLNGVRFASDTSNTTLTDVDVANSVVGIEKSTGADIDGLAINGGSFVDGYIGIDFAKDTGAGQAGNGLATNVTIDGTHFEDLTAKGVYVEALSHSLITGVTMDNVGFHGSGAAFGGPYAGVGIEVNLKNGVYSDITITDFAFTDTGTSAHDNSAAISVKTRDDSPSYDANPATWTGGPLVVSNGTVDGTTTGIRAGETGKNVAGPPVAVTAVTITDALHNAQNGDVENLTQSTMTVTGTGGADTISASPQSTGAIVWHGAAGNDTLAGQGEVDTIFGEGDNDTLTGAGGNDTLDGGGGKDTAVYAATLASGNISFVAGHWQVAAGGSEGTDAISNIEKIDHGGTANFLLVGGGGYANFAAAQLDAQLGDIILVAPSTPTLSAVVDHHLVEAKTASPGVASATALLTKSDSLNTVAYDTSVLVAGGWTNQGGGVFTKGSTYGTATLNSGANTLTFALDNAAANILVATDHPTADFVVPVINGNGVQASTTVHFVIDGANDLPSAITDTNADADEVSEEAADGTAVGVTAHATDVESAVTYSLSDDAGGRFAIDASTGVVTVADGSLFDFEEAPSHVITVRASDADGGFSERPFTIDLTNVPGEVITVPPDSGPVTGTKEPDTITGNKGDDIIFGGGGDDVVNTGKGKNFVDGGDGDDLINVGKGKDTIIGGAGEDTVSYETSKSGVKIDLNKTGGQKGGDAQGDVLSGIEDLVGSNSADTLTGNAADNVLDGRGGDDRLSGRGGHDTLIGGTGDDVFNFAKNFDNDTVADYRAGHDSFDLSGTSFHSFKAMKSHMTDTGAGVVIDFGDGDSLTIANATIKSLTQHKGDFDFT